VNANQRGEVAARVFELAGYPGADTVVTSMPTPFGDADIVTIAVRARVPRDPLGELLAAALNAPAPGRIEDDGDTIVRGGVDA
jgi:hypothetical protein